MGPLLVLGRREVLAVEQPGGQPVGGRQHHGEGGHPCQGHVRDPPGAVRDTHQREHAPARGPRIAGPLLRPVEHEGGGTSPEAGGAPGSAGGTVAPTDDVGELRPPAAGIVELTSSEFVPERQDLRRPARGPADDHGAHARIIRCRGEICRSVSRTGSGMSMVFPECVRELSIEGVRPCACSQRTAAVRRRFMGRSVGLGIAAVIGLVLVPGTASAAPVDAQVSAAQQAADAAAAEVGQLLTRLGDAQAAVDDASARAALARTDYEVGTSPPTTRHRPSRRRRTSRRSGRRPTSPARGMPSRRSPATATWPAPPRRS